MELLKEMTAASTLVGTALGWLPAIAALFAIVWYGFKIHDRIKYGPIDPKK